MKKLSLLISLILCVTIGGVYATWIYSGNVNVADISEPITINLEDAANGGAHGTYTINKNIAGETFFRIDQANENHEAKLVIPEGTTIELVFTPSVHAPEYVKDGTNFPTFIYFSGNLDTLQYAGQKVFAPLTKTSLDTAGEKITWTVRDGKLVFDLMPLIIEQVKLNGTIKLDTLSDYNDFSAIIDTSKLVIHVSDGVLADPTTQGE